MGEYQEGATHETLHNKIGYTTLSGRFLREYSEFFHTDN